VVGRGEGGRGEEREGDGKIFIVKGR